ncbi:hypothetical protein GRJ2_001909400 [Grus japonensis]|uniref:Uncharacterized protein n=1 Tax=Grus japonensis TaxID=30415 RepID=A0ABC9X9S3_GRUJA
MEDAVKRKKTLQTPVERCMGKEWGSLRPDNHGGSERAMVSPIRANGFGLFSHRFFASELLKVLSSVKPGLSGLCQQYVSLGVPDSSDSTASLGDLAVGVLKGLLPSEHLLGDSVFGGLASSVHALNVARLLKGNADLDPQVLATVCGPSSAG